jgi:hypothetical protein
MLRSVEEDGEISMGWVRKEAVVASFKYNK